MMNAVEVASHIPYPTLIYALSPQALLKGGENISQR